MTEKARAEEWNEATAEILIAPDGKIRVFGLNETLMDVLSVVSGSDALRRKQAMAKASRSQVHDRAEQPAAACSDFQGGGKG